ncbi:MAG TPA: heme biosynthesis HemY N-terminal domain-containing protein [Alphaproteobacteria bacterium]|nr:heme biosynthesis HemY N-terminal domain-containing protein [Alphaproteobacteria bacterium]
MIVRALVIFALLAVISALAAWLTDNPGQVSVVWQGYRIDTSVGIILSAVALLAIVFALLYRLWRAIFSTVRVAKRVRGQRRMRDGYLALSRGLVAVAAGDADEAKRQARRADNLLEEPALTHLLAAQAAQLDNDDNAARRYYADLIERRETEFLGVRGLLTLAERDGDKDRALELARRAEMLRPEIPWVSEKLFALEVEAGNWAAAEGTVKQAVRRKVLDTEVGKRRRAAVLMEQSRLAEADDDNETALLLARKALADAPEMTAAAIRFANLLKAGGEDRRARKVIEEAYAGTPHPKLARLYVEVTPSADPIKRLKTLEKLEKLAPDHATTHIVMAEASLEARLWGEARRHLKAASADGLTAGICRLMAAVEEAEHGATDTARAWYNRAGEAEPDAGWVCGHCGAVADDWSAICANCGVFDRLAWATPPRVSALPAREAQAIAEQAIAAIDREVPKPVRPPAGEPPAASALALPPQAGDPAATDPDRD